MRALLTCDRHDTDRGFPGHGETEERVVVVNVGKLGDQGEGLVQLPGESLASLAVLGQPQVVVGGQQDVAQRPPGGVRGQRVGLHAVDDGGHTQVDVGSQQEEVEGVVVVQGSSVHLDIY